jgi:hypothetical protein
MPILFVSGVNDLSQVGVSLDQQGRFATLLDGNCSIHHRLPLREGAAAEVVLFGKGVQQRQFTFPRPPSLIFNQIADTDTHRGALQRCVELCASVDAQVVNHPEKIMRTARDQVSRVLQGIPGVVMPRTIRFNPRSPEDVFEHAAREGFAVPFIVREAGLHGGKNMLRADRAGDHAPLHVFPFDGRDFYLTEYVGCSDAEGHYHRQRLVVVDGEVLLRGSLYDRDWKVHGASRSYMLQRESWDDDRARAQWLESEVIPQAVPAVKEISRRLQLEFYGIDCYLRPGREMVVFEANANMNILTNDHPQMNPRMDMIKERIRAMLARRSGEAL